jgi:hypothetical protein
MTAMMRIYDIHFAMNIPIAIIYFNCNITGFNSNFFTYFFWGTHKAIWCGSARLAIRQALVNPHPVTLGFVECCASQGYFWFTFAGVTSPYTLEKLCPLGPTTAGSGPPLHKKIVE